MKTDSLILGIDTSGKKCSVILWRGGNGLFEKSVTAPNLHSTLLAEFVRTGLETIGMPATAVQLVSVTSGPGSFTGLRIGMAYAKGFCFARECPLVTVTNFEVLADQASGYQRPIYTLIDARRNSFYVGIFTGDVLRLDGYKIITAGELKQQVRGKCCVVIAEETDFNEGALPAGEQATIIRLPIDIGTVCRLGGQKFLAGIREDLQSLEPLYIQPFGGVT